MDIKEFLFENWRIILEACLVVTSAIIFCLRKKPVKVVDSIKQDILQLLPGCINAAEMQKDLSGSDKLEFALSLVLGVLKEHGYGDDVVSQYLSFIRSQVEVILSTPQKKVR